MIRQIAPTRYAPLQIAANPASSAPRAAGSSLALPAVVLNSLRRNRGSVKQANLNPSSLFVRPRGAYLLGSLASMILAACAGCTGNAETTTGAGGGAGGFSGTTGSSGTGEPGSTAKHLTVTLQTYSGNYLVADEGGGAALAATSTTPSAWETFTLSDLDGGALLSGDVVTLRGSSGQWASAVDGGGGVINFTASSETAWEKFSLVKLSGDGAIESGDKVALRTTVSGQFLSAKDAGGGTVSATAPEALEWETLTLNITDTSGAGGGGGGGTGETTPPDFGPNVLIFDPSMSMDTIQSKIDAVFAKQESNHFGEERYTYFFKPGQYDLDVQVGFYMTVLGLGQSPDDVTITGAVRSKADWFNGNATQNFWRAAENLAVIPTKDSNTEVWAVSQATALRRLHVKGKINLWDGGWSSGGFIADSKIDEQITSGSQQQFLTRNTALGSWQGSSWNMVFVGDEQTPAGSWAGSGYTVVDSTPTVREKPYLVIDSAGKYSVRVPALEKNSKGISWGAGQAAGTSLPIGTFHVARSDKDTANTINAALAAGKNLILTPGIYHLASSLEVKKAGTVILGLGLATLIPDQGNAAMTIADVDGVTVGGVLFDAGASNSPTLLTIGAAKSAVSHAINPTALFDVSCRVGGASAGNATSCVEINSNDVQIDNVWLWRADHGSGVGWDVNKSKNGLTVNGDDVSAYGLFVEHFEGYQTLWNGNGGRVYFYQSEIPYDVPSQNAWTHDGVKGYSSYKVADAVTSHDARGLGVYSVFNNPVVLENAIETPSSAGVKMQHMITVFLGSTGGAAINHIINGTGGTVNNGNMQAKSAN